MVGDTHIHRATGQSVVDAKCAHPLNISFHTWPITGAGCNLLSKNVTPVSNGRSHMTSRCKLAKRVPIILKFGTVFSTHDLPDMCIIPLVRFLARTLHALPRPIPKFRWRFSSCSG